MTDVHVGYVLKRFPRLSETFVAAELLELQRQGQPVTVFAVSRPNEAVQHGFLDELHVRVVYLPYRPLGEPLRTARAEGRTAAVKVTERDGQRTSTVRAMSPVKIAAAENT